MLVGEAGDVGRGRRAVRGRRGRELVRVGDPRRLDCAGGDRGEALLAEIRPVRVSRAPLDPTAHPEAPLARLGEALDLAVEDPDLAPDGVLHVGLGIARTGGERLLHRSLGDLPEVHAEQSQLSLANNRKSQQFAANPKPPQKISVDLSKALNVRVLAKNNSC